MSEQLAVRYSVPHWYDDVAQMLGTERPDVLHITTPPQSHLSLTRQAVAAGCHVFLEKPVALHHCDAEAIVDAAVGAGRKLSVNYWPNFEAPALELRQLYQSGVLGSPISRGNMGWRSSGTLIIGYIAYPASYFKTYLIMC
jgi:predicted dehydrogenase